MKMPRHKRKQFRHVHNGTEKRGGGYTKKVLTSIKESTAPLVTVEEEEGDVPKPLFKRNVKDYDK